MEQLRTGLEGQAGLLKRAPLIEAGLTAETARHCAAMIRKCKWLPIPRDIPEDHALAEFDRKITKVPPVHLLARAWRLLADVLEGSEEIAPHTLFLEQAESGTRSLRLRWR